MADNVPMPMTPVPVLLTIVPLKIALGFSDDPELPIAQGGTISHLR
jgi:hypothetical protein